MTTTSAPSAEAIKLASEGAMKPKAAMAFLGIGRTKFYELVAAGELPFSYVGADRVYLRQGLVMWLAARMPCAEQAAPTPPRHG